MSSTGVVLIHDEKQVQIFFEKVLHPTAIGCKYLRPGWLLNLSVRSKYMPESNHKKAINGFFERQIFINNGHHSLTYAIQRWETRRPHVFDGVEIPSHALSVYICLNPRDQAATFTKMNAGVSNILAGMALSGTSGDNLPRSFTSEYYSTFHNAVQEKQWVEIDVDTKDPQVLRKLITPELVENVSFIVETRGGYHLVYSKDAFPKDVHKVIKSAENKYTEKSRDGKVVSKVYLDIRGDVCIPVPGTYQGGFAVQMLTISGFKAVLASDSNGKEAAEYATLQSLEAKV